jgi:hypothetical protein
MGERRIAKRRRQQVVKPAGARGEWGLAFFQKRFQNGLFIQAGNQTIGG